MASCDLVSRDRAVLGGLKGTRVPVRTPFEYLEYGYTLEEFLDNFPSVSRELAGKVLESAESALIATAA
jgi:uncharacterized protein (DUF433 family)